MAFIWACLFLSIVLISWFVNLLGLPGNWLIVVASATYAWWMPPDSRVAMSWPMVGVITGLALIGEFVELFAGAAGVNRLGGSWRAAILALFGSVVGAFVGLFVGIPIPVIGSLVAALVFAGMGALVGAVIGESWKGRTMEHSLEIGQAAFWGRIMGTLAKTIIGAIMVGAALAAV